ncbi:MAG: ribbon-helix-helix domain-containing protein [Alphaproteobacteria bacterium]|nr:ribbon-helix-helix domain-containing protein [Alphaproteobacteria bacterium]
MSTLINKNVMVDGHRTSMRLEPEMWDALTEICARERCNIHQLCSQLELNRQSSTLTAAMRVYIMNYFRQAMHSLMNDGRGYDAAVSPLMKGMQVVGANRPHLANRRHGNEVAVQG